MIILGDKEVSNATVSVRLRNGEQLEPETVDNFLEKIKYIISNKSQNLAL